MKQKKLMESFSLLDDDLIAEANPHAAKPAAKILLKKWLITAISACLVLAIVIPVVWIASSSNPALTSGEPGVSDNVPTQTTPSGTTNSFDSPTITNADPPEAPEDPSVDEELADGVPMAPGSPSTGSDGNHYTDIIENGFVKVSETAESFFSIDVSTASYPNIRATLKRGLLPQKNAFRTEEILNYFKFDYTTPTNGDVFALNASMFPNPYNRDTLLLTVGLAAEAVEFTNVQNNLVFLIDVSGSMYSADKLPLAQKAFSMLVDNLNPNDRVSIVTYAGDDRVALSGAYGDEKDTIKAVIDDLQAGGSTAGAAGINTAYELAREYFIEGGNNRVILMTDGDFNVGTSSVDGLKNLITEKRQSGVYFSVYGFGTSNWQADKMEALALAGNGMYGYIDSELEAKRALVDEIGGSLVTVAKDVKAGIRFDADFIDSYRLVGYETKQMNEDDFNNTEKDAGEIGSGHTVTVVYEIKLCDGALSQPAKLGSVEIRFKDPKTDENKSLTLDLMNTVYHETMTANDAFVASVVEFVLLARESDYKADASFDSLITRLDDLDFTADTFKAEFRESVKLYYQIMMAGLD